MLWNYPLPLHAHRQRIQRNPQAERFRSSPSSTSPRPSSVCCAGRGCHALLACAEVGFSLVDCAGSLQQALSWTPLHCRHSLWQLTAALSLSSLSPSAVQCSQLLLSHARSALLLPLSRMTFSSCWRDKQNTCQTCTQRSPTTWAFSPGYAEDISLTV